MIEPFSGSLPLGFDHWSPAFQGLFIAVLTFVQEDVPVITAALLASDGKMGLLTGYLGSFLGIWIGDALLYLAARLLGNKLKQMRIFQRLVRPEAIAKSEKWFAERGTRILVLSRVIPGARLPTYLAAGFLRSPFGSFLAVTAFAAAVWVTAIFLIAFLAGPIVVKVLRNLGLLGWIGVAGLILFLFLRSRISRGSRIPLRTKFRAFLYRWTHWEFWPAWLFYAPVLVNYVRLALRYGGWTLPTVANPGIFSGGIVGESKFATLRELTETSPEFTARTWPIPSSALGTQFETQLETRFETLQRLQAEHQVEYPFVLKPDIGQRGVGVKIIRNRDQCIEYLRANTSPLVLQEYVSGPFEIGVFYYRFPSQPRGQIFAITEKIFPEIIGDGLHTVEELIWSDSRARALATTYLKRFSDRLPQILPKGEALKLVEAGNHAQGCIFRDGAHFNSPALEACIDQISRKINGFFVGRFDIRFASVEKLRNGLNFKILELNGAASEATSIYDARNSLADAYRTLFKQWELVFAIGAANRARGHSSTPAPLLWQKWRETTALVASYPIAD